MITPMSPRAQRHFAILLLAVLSMAAVAGALRPGYTLASVHSALRKPLDAGISPDDLLQIEENNNFDTGDQLFQVLPERHAFNRALSNGELPLWWPEAGGGISLLGAPGAELLEPRALGLSLLFGDRECLGIQAALTLFALALSTFLWLSQRGLSLVSALCGAVSFGLGGALTANLYYICKVDAMILLPAGLLAMEWFCRGRRGSGFLLLSLAAADSALASFPQNTAAAIYGLGIAGVFRLVEFGRERGALAALRCALTLGVALALGLGLSLVHLLPVAEWMQQSGRPASLGGLGFRANATNWLSAVAPLVLGNPTSRWAALGNPIPDLLPGLCDPQGRYNFTETTIYFGLLGIPFLFGSLFAGRRALPGIMGFLFFAGAAAGPPVALLPGLNVGAPSRALAGASFFAAWLVAEGVEGFMHCARVRIACVAGTVILLFAGGGAMVLRLSPRLQAGALVDRVVALRTARGGATDTEATTVVERRWSTEVQPELQRIALLAFGAMFVMGLALAVPGAQWLLLLFLAGDLVWFGQKILPSQPIHQFLVETPAVREVRKAAGAGRVVRVSPQARVETQDWQVFQSTLPSYFDIYDTAAYVVFPNQTQVDVAAALFPRSVFENTYLAAFPVGALDAPVLDLLGASLVISRGRIERGDLVPVVLRNGFCAYQRRNWIGPAWIAPEGRIVDGDDAMRAALKDTQWRPERTALLEGDGVVPAPAAAGGGTVEIERVSNREVRFHVRNTGGGYLVESAHFCSGWTATVDGFPAKLLRANRYGRAVHLTAGDHEVKFLYMPQSFLWGAAAALACALLIPMAALRAARREFLI
jgi:hypothetical protein